MNTLEILILVWISIQLIAGVVSFILLVVFDKKDQKRLVVVSVPHYEEPESAEDFKCYCDCCYQQDHVCMNPEGICSDQTKED